MNYSTENVRSLFNTIAPKYDLANSCMSFHLHALWNRYLAKKALSNNPERIIDLCAGTGEIAFRMMQRAKKKQSSLPAIHLVDFSENMLEVAQLRQASFDNSTREKFSFETGNVEALTRPSSHFQTATCAYGIRNVQNKEKCLQEAFRVLSPQGSFFVLELTRPNNKALQLLHRLYLKSALPLIGKCLVKNKQAYEYLQRSIEHFAHPQELAELGKKVGFSHVTIEPLHFGIATLITFRKP